MRNQSHNSPIRHMNKRHGSVYKLLLNADKNRKILAIVQNSIPASLFHTCVAATIIDDLLTIVTSSQGAAGKLHYYTQEILKNVRTHHHHHRSIQHIKIKTAHALVPPPQRKANEVKPLSEGAIECIQAAARHIADVDLKKSLERLAEHARKKSKSGNLYRLEE